ncbi:hypothetical protein ISF_00050 [Cordyceps fumosorosea ARSEF 2679]|uniref:Tetratricopeptide-like helical n=1 Tax=Cordyceps fumosorosea (strain ARSEF 2679) TaxID=1081104 RepID=A0A162MZN9_CORFA|nr:hypothetical protein ISF_00050 [Cordyceps fumosorosea ARSEF 2679]OAA73149.1 hypothetical protein ISF_00050 [Cordyceps fumosorosea ARSEF 2679]
MIADPAQHGRDLVWQAQHELWKAAPDFKRVLELGMEALKDFTQPRDRANACLVVAKGHEGLRQWEFAYNYWSWCSSLYPESWNDELRARMEDCRRRRDEVERARRGSAGGYRP